MPRNALKKADEWITNALIGTGYGIRNQLEGLYQMGAHPVNTLRGFGELAQNPGQIPGMVSNALIDTAQRATSGPLGFGEVLGENLSPSMFRGRVPNRQELITYHGSNSDFDKFDMNRIGTGAGAQTEGFGVYLTTSPKYAKTFGKNVYKVDIPDDATILKWDAPVNEQPAAFTLLDEAGLVSSETDVRAIRQLARERKNNVFRSPEDKAEAAQILAMSDAELENAKLFPPYRSFSADQSRLSGEDLFRGLESKFGKKYAAQKVKKAGIVGMEMPTAHDLFGSRAPKGTRNFVIFDPEVAKILKRE